MSIKGYSTVWEIMKQTADKEELKELEAIEKRYQEKPAALNPLGQKLMKQKVNPLDKIPGELVKNYELYDDPKPEDLKTLKQWTNEQGPLEKKAQSGKLLTQQEKDYVKANPYGLTREAYKHIKAETAPPPQFINVVKKQKPFVKKQIAKKPDTKTANQIIQDLKINMPTVVEPLTKSAEEITAEQKFFEMVRQSEEEKQRIKNGGLAYLMGGAKND